MFLRMSFPRRRESRTIPAELVPAQAGRVKPEIQKAFIQIFLDSRLRGNDNKDKRGVTNSITKFLKIKDLTPLLHVQTKDIYSDRRYMFRSKIHIKKILIMKVEPFSHSYV